MLPDYIAKAVPNPKGNRSPWYANTAPSYAGIFLWIAFYRSMAGDTLAHGGLGVCFAGLILAGLLCHFLYYLAPALLGMINDSGSFSIITTYLRLAAAGHPISAFRADEYYWRDLGRPEHISQATADIDQGVLALL